MFDCYNRKITYLRISVTDKCNFRCTYCMPEEGVPLLNHSDILSFDEIMEVVRIGVANGITKIRLTGGEPLVRKGIVSLVEMIAQTKGVTDFGLTTNGVLLVKYAADLKKAGLHRLNISLDTINAERFKQITRLGTLNDVFAGIHAAQQAGFDTIKINTVIKKSADEPDAREVKKFCDENGLKIRYIREMDLEAGKFWKVQGGDGGDCTACNRLRLTANGLIKPCLFSNLEYNVRKLGAENAYLMAIKNKPESGSANHFDRFNNLGG